MSSLINTSYPMMSIDEFMSKESINVEKLYIDRFWSSIEDDTMILIDDLVIRWMGYEANEIFSAKQSIMRLLNRMKDAIYEHINQNDLKNNSKLLKLTMVDNSNPSTMARFTKTDQNNDSDDIIQNKEKSNLAMMARFTKTDQNNDSDDIIQNKEKSSKNNQNEENEQDFNPSIVDGLDNTNKNNDSDDIIQNEEKSSYIIQTKAKYKKYLFVDSDTFKNVCMRLGTNRGDQIRTMYINLEKLYKKYTKYTQAYNSKMIESNKKALEIERISHQTTKLELKTKEDALEEEKNRTLFWKDRVENKIPLKAKNYIYVVADPIHAKEGIYKVGHTENPYSRLSNYNTRAADVEDRFTYLALYGSINAQATERLLFSLLDNFRLNGNKEFVKMPLDILKHICNDLLMTEKRIIEKINNFLETNKYEEDKYGNADISYNFVYKDTDQNIGKIKCSICNKLVGFSSYKKHTEKCEQAKNSFDETQPLDTKPIRRKKRTTESINQTFLKYNIQLLEPYNHIYEAPQKFVCLSKFKHEYETSVDNMKDSVVTSGGCTKCKKHSIVNNIRLYSYKTDMSFDMSFKDMEDLKSKRITNYQLIRNNIREMRWLCPVNGYIYSILEPDTNGKLNIHKSLNEIESTIVEILDIDYEALRNNLSKKEEYIYAIDVELNKVFKSNNATAFSRCLVNKLKPDLTVNRKTIPKFLNGTKQYAGYLWKTYLSDEYKDWEITEYR